HGFIREYYYHSKYVPTENAQCSCGHRFRAREYIIQSGELHSEYRHIPGKGFESLEPGELLGEEERIEAMAKFIQISLAFTKTGRNRKD
ncbi:hypothetical protein GYMLUDRAFT_126059, partial [Collybiopsis luxurians FD-317 M1]